LLLPQAVDQALNRRRSSSLCLDGYSFSIDAALAFVGSSVSRLNQEPQQ
jgi:hypothetical protein